MQYMMLAVSGQMVVLIIGTALSTVGVALCLISLIIKRKAKKQDIINNVEVKNGVRYTTNKTATTEYGDVLVSHRELDIILERGITYVVAKKGKIIPGKYAVLSSDNNVDKFNVRIGGLVREMEHCGNIVLAEGEEIAALSHSLILR